MLDHRILFSCIFKQFNIGNQVNQYALSKLSTQENQHLNSGFGASI